MSKEEKNKAIENCENALFELQRELHDLENARDNFETSDHATNEQYDDFLDEIYGDVDICGYMYSSSRALEELYPVAYRCGFNDYCDGLDKEDFPEYQEIREQIEIVESKIDDLEDEIQSLEDEEGKEEDV